MALVSTSDSCLLEKCRKSVSRVSTSVLLTMLLFFPSTVHCLGRPQLSRVFAVAMWENDRSLKFRSVTPWSKRRWKVDGHNSIGSRSYACSSFDTTNVYLMLESTSNAWILSVWVEASIQCMPWLYTKMMTWSGRHLSRTARQPPTTVPHPKKWVVTDFWYVPQLSKEGFEFTAQPIVSSLQTIQTLTLAGQCEHKGPAEGCADWPQLDLHLWYLEKKRHPRILHKLPSKGLDLIYKRMRRLHHPSREFWTSAMALLNIFKTVPTLGLQSNDHLGSKRFTSNTRTADTCFRSLNISQKCGPSEFWSHPSGKPKNLDRDAVSSGFNWKWFVNTVFVPSVQSAVSHESIAEAPLPVAAYSIWKISVCSSQPLDNDHEALT